MAVQAPSVLGVLATLNLNGPGLSAPLTPAQQSIVERAVGQVLGSVPGVSNVTLMNAQVLPAL